MRVLAAGALATGLFVAGASNAAIFYEGFGEYNNAGVAYGSNTSGANTAPAGSNQAGDSFTTAYGFRSGATNTGTNSMYDEGTWTIGTNPFAVHSLWINQPSSNPFLMLNGATDDQASPTAYLSDQITVGAGTFSYSYDLLNLCCNADGPTGTPSLLQMWYYAPGSATPTAITLTNIPQTAAEGDGWEHISGNFTLAAGGTIQLGLSDTTSIASGNDFGVDSITLTSVPEPATWGLMIMGFGGIGAMLRSRRKGLAAA